MYKFKSLLITLIIFSNFPLFSQEKGILKKNVSPKITEFLAQNYPKAKGVKFYQEIEKDKLFIEIEFELGEDEYSLKFHNDSIYEVEIELDFKQLPDAIKQSITNQLDSLFVKYKITECLVVNLNTSNSLYEIYVRSKSKNGSGEFELYFNKNGKLEKEVELISHPISTHF